MCDKIRVAILDDHQSIIDGYLYRLSGTQEIEVVATATFGEELEPMLNNHGVDVLLLDVLVPTSATNPNPYPILHLIPRLLQTYPDLVILVLSMHAQRALIRAVVEAGASGYLLKDDQSSIEELGSIIRSVASGGIHFSQQAHQQLFRSNAEEDTLTPRQREALSLAAAYPNLTSSQLADRLGIAQSTVRNLLSNAYLRLGVRNRSAAITKARRMGLITPPAPPLELG
jgi:two-component system nitrate/nitrite response regulator NarL